MKYNNKKIISFLFSIVLLSTSFISSSAIAGVLVTPSRVVFEDGTRSAKITLLNKGDEQNTFRISFIRQNMDENGAFHPIETNQDGFYSDEFIRFSPRQITLNPGQTQTVRLLLRKKRGMQDGEYRSHLMIQALPKVTSSDIKNLSAQSDKAISVTISTVLGISVPVIVRQGNLSSSIKLRNAKLFKDEKDNKPKIKVELHRTGNKSTYGDLTVKFKSPNNEEKTIAYAKGVAVYSNRDMRYFNLNVSDVDIEKISNGMLSVTYSESTKKTDEKSSQTIKVKI